MRTSTISFWSQIVRYYFDASFEDLDDITEMDNVVFVTDENVYSKHSKRFKKRKVIILPPGESNKVQRTANNIIKELIETGADRKTVLIGVGGGVVTDITGYVAATYLRGIRSGFIPTTVLAMVDAAIGGKNGIDVGLYKNMVGTIRQPDFILFDTSFLKTLSKEEWRSGFAEIIKHACIKDASMFSLLENSGIAVFQKDYDALSTLIEQNVLLKTKIVKHDEFEEHERRLLNFGHTLGHAIENNYHLMHGYAVSIGMVVAAMLSEQECGFQDTQRLTNLLAKYNLPVKMDFNVQKALKTMTNDKKRIKDVINYVLLEKIGYGFIRPLTIEQIEPAVKKFVEG